LPRPSYALPRAFHRTAASLGCFQQFGCEPLPHRLLATLARRFAEPAHRQSHAAHRAHFDRDLEVRATNPTAFDLDIGFAFESAWLKHFKRILAPFLVIDSNAP